MSFYFSTATRNNQKKRKCAGEVKCWCFLLCSREKTRFDDARSTYLTDVLHKLHTTLARFQVTFLRCDDGTAHMQHASSLIRSLNKHRCCERKLKSHIYECLCAVAKIFSRSWVCCSCWKICKRLFLFAYLVQDTGSFFTKWRVIRECYVFDVRLPRCTTEISSGRGLNFFMIFTFFDVA